MFRRPRLNLWKLLVVFLVLWFLWVGVVRPLYIRVAGFYWWMWP